MRANEFLVETNISDSLINEFFNNCSEYFTHNQYPLTNLLWRGDRTEVPANSFSKIIRKVSKGRKPTDTDEYIHQVFNNWFTTKFNYPFRDGMMCVGNERAASEYGITYIIVPCNGYTLCYSPKINDLFRKIPSGAYSYLEYVQFDVHDGTPEKTNAIAMIKKLIYGLLDSGNYVAGPQHTNNAIMSGNEVMLYPTNYSALEYYAFTEEFWHSTVASLIKKRFNESP